MSLGRLAPMFARLTGSLKSLEVKAWCHKGCDGTGSEGCGRPEGTPSPAFDGGRDLQSPLEDVVP